MFNPHRSRGADGIIWEWLISLQFESKDFSPSTVSIIARVPKNGRRVLRREGLLLNPRIEYGSRRKAFSAEPEILLREISFARASSRRLATKAPVNHRDPQMRIAGHMTQDGGVSASGIRPSEAPGAPMIPGDLNETPFWLGEQIIKTGAGIPRS
jgi:hypothetical protein